MSLIRRPRVVIDGVRRTRTYRFFQCNHCNRTVRISPSSSTPNNLICPLRYTHLRQELHLPTPPQHAEGPTPSTSASQLLDTMVQMLEISPTNMIRYGRPQATLPAPHHQENALSNGANHKPSDHMPPYPTAEMECPVCKEELLAGEQIQALPCSHLYHSSCIMPWLQAHNTCPICRFQITVSPPTITGDYDNNNNTNFTRERNRDFQGANDFRFEDVWSLNWPTWDEFLSLWPFGYPIDPVNHRDSSTRTVLSWWRFLTII